MAIRFSPFTTRPQFRILNMSPSVAEVTLEAYQNDGTATRILELFPVARSGTKTVFQMESGGSVEAFTAEDVPPLNGWIHNHRRGTASRPHQPSRPGIPTGGAFRFHGVPANFKHDSSGLLRSERPFSRRRIHRNQRGC